MILSQSAFEAYDTALRRQAEEAAAKMAAFMDTLDFSGDYESRKAARNRAIEFMQYLVEIYGDAAATLAADLYNEMAELSGTRVPSAKLAPPTPAENVATSVRAHAKNLFGQVVDVEGFKQGVLSAVRRYINQQANATITLNVERDGKSESRGIRFARIPTGDETCAFCLMLASRGFVYMSEVSAEGKNHGHENCDCRIVPGFGSDAAVEGFDHRPYLAFYEDNVKYDQYGHVREEDTLNGMRRALYPKYRDRRNALRRKRYAEAKKAEKAE